MKCQFYWDRYSAPTTRIVPAGSGYRRHGQASAGARCSFRAIGQEVIVEYLEGNPDRPIITGRVYNATQTAFPTRLPDKATQSTFKSNSSKGGGGYNEIRFEDKKDSEEIYFQAQKDYNKVVLNNETVKIKQDTTTTVQNRATAPITVSKGNNTKTVSQGNDALTVSTGNHSMDVTRRRQQERRPVRPSR